MDIRVSDSIVDYWKKISFSYESILKMDSLKYEESVKVSEELKESLRKEKIKNLKTSIGVGIGGTLLGLLLGILL